jgi:hypothetical protein
MNPINKSLDTVRLRTATLATIDIPAAFFLAEQSIQRSAENVLRKYLPTYHVIV